MAMYYVATKLSTVACTGLFTRRGSSKKPKQQCNQSQQTDSSPSTVTCDADSQDAEKTEAKVSYLNNTVYNFFFVFKNTLNEMKF